MAKLAVPSLFVLSLFVLPLSVLSLFVLSLLVLFLFVLSLLPSLLLSSLPSLYKVDHQHKEMTEGALRNRQVSQDQSRTQTAQRESRWKSRTRL